MVRKFAGLGRARSRLRSLLDWLSYLVLIVSSLPRPGAAVGDRSGRDELGAGNIWLAIATFNAVGPDLDQF
ncbi:hypothetical protein [Bradyrhizobium liaoningense]|uniref:hypothetical protein n=1 Tax=Bradyrhizobium liaoningense TaxID=43992 RepID=UPI001BA9D935|nr:hypothetical protein [Bradyrhizobium liaoningense]MBR0816891.1 hypothetical protein [Bradyrhizobium liaoningense]